LHGVDNASTKLSPALASPITTFEDLARRQHIATASCLFRNGLFDFPEEFFLNVFGTDYALNLLNSYYGKIKLIDEEMGVYRIQQGGEWSGRALLERAEKALDTVLKCKDFFAPRAAADFDYHAALLKCFLEFERREFVNFRAAYWHILRRHFRYLGIKDIAALSARYILSSLPRLIQTYGNITSRLKT
jgi:hypothetical protein